jgi:hypothetical protein
MPYFACQIASDVTAEARRSRQEAGNKKDAAKQQAGVNE